MAELNENNLKTILNNFRALDERLADPAVSADSNRLTQLSRERSRLAHSAELIETYFSLRRQLDDLNRGLQIESDAAMKSELLTELKIVKQNVERCSADLQIELIPKDIAEGRDVYLEIRAGTGGDEASLFAYDLFRMYTRFLDKEGVSYEIVDFTETGLSGAKEAVILVKGLRAYELLHQEAGTHRVQRIPATEANGRIHTSACTVAVVPEADEDEIVIDPGDLRIDVFRSSGAGGQHVNKTESAVRITHIPSGIVVGCQEEKSQIKNRAKAMKALKSKLVEKQKREAQEKMATEKKAQVGSGDRSEKIRTYNFPQNRLTDHRIGYTSHNLDQVMEGKLNDIIQALLLAEREEKMKLHDKTISEVGR